jgi:hypothetical protein
MYGDSYVATFAAIAMEGSSAVECLGGCCIRSWSSGKGSTFLIVKGNPGSL